MKGSIIMLITMAAMVTGCAVSLEKSDLARYENIGVICLLENNLQFTEQGPLPIQIKQKIEEAADWGIVENLQKTSHELLRTQFNPVSLEYDTASLIDIFNERDSGTSWPNLSQNQVHALQEIIRDKPVDAVLVIKAGWIPLGEIKGVIQGMGIFHKKLLFLSPRVQIHSILSGRVFDTTKMEAIAYHGDSVSDFSVFSDHPWSFGFIGMTEQAKQEAKVEVKKSGDQALRKVLIKLGLVDG